MPRHVVVDGSNIATEGRTTPSLRQLNDAVMAFIEENPTDIITVVVDATFGHRIDSAEVAEFDAAVENNELVSPPAGAIGRGDAFVLTIANKAHAVILSNDSFQEFHGEYPWLFDDGRLLGGKPVPNVGWVFVPRAPVRGPVSRRATRDATGRKKAEPKKAGRPSRAASEPMPTPKVPPPVKRVERARTGRGSAAPPATATSPTAAAPPPAKRAEAPTAARPGHVNELLPFLDFVERHPVGTTVEATIDSYSSHGAYAMVGPVRCYLPLRYIASPAPRSARDVVALGDRRELVVVSFNPARRGIDVAVPELVPAGIRLVTAAPVVEAPKKAGRARKKSPSAVAVEAEAPPAAPRTRKKKAATTDTAAKAPARARKKAAPADVAGPAAASAGRPPAPNGEDGAAAPVAASAVAAEPEAAKRPSRTRKKAAAAVPPSADGPGTGAEPTGAAPATKKASRTRKKAAGATS